MVSVSKLPFDHACCFIGGAVWTANSRGAPLLPPQAAATAAIASANASWRRPYSKEVRFRMRVPHSGIRAELASQRSRGRFDKEAARLAKVLRELPRVFS